MRSACSFLRNIKNTSSSNNNNNNEEEEQQQQEQDTPSSGNTFKAPLPIQLDKKDTKDSDDDDNEEDEEDSCEEDDEEVQFPLKSGPQVASSSSSSKVVSSSTRMPTTGQDSARRKKVMLGPGYGPLDWAALKSSPKNDLRGGVTQLQRFTPEELAKHKTREDCWMAVQGKVYNVTPYLKYHPGGVGQLMRGAGKDATKLYMETHSWVNIDNLLAKCHIGFLVNSNHFLRVV